MQKNIICVACPMGCGVTVDIAEDKTLIEAAGMGNCALSDMQEKALKKWLKEISK